MNPKPNLSKLKRCDQIWDSMQSCDSGRLCAQCNQVIFDFRGKTEWEIALKHAQSETKVCGIYDKKAFVKKEPLGSKMVSGKRIVVAGTVGLLATSFPAFSQNDTELVKTELAIEGNSSKPNDQNPNHQNSDSNPKDRSYVLTGTLTDISENPLEGATIWIQGTEKGVFTDGEGKFGIDISRELARLDSITIVASYIGYGREEITITKSSFRKHKQQLNIEIRMGERREIIAFTVRRPPFHKRVWYGFKNIFRKKG